MMRWAVLALVLGACTPAPIPVPAPTDAAPTGDIYDQACGVLAKLGCAEGTFPACAPLMRRVDLDHLFDTHAVCLAKARTLSDVEACGAICQKR